MIEKRQEVAFNIGMAQSYFVANLYQKAVTRFYIEGDFKGSYDVTRGIATILYSDLKSEERIELDDLKNAVGEKYLAWKGTKKKKEYLLAKEDFIGAVEEYLTSVFKYLRPLGYLPSKKQREMLF